MNSYPIGILLAAGGSRRLGKPKQLVKYQGKALVQHIAETFLKTFPRSELIIILGSSSNEILSNLSKVQKTALINDEWHKGVSTSIKTAQSYISNNYSEQSSFLMMSCDQYLLSSKHLQNLFKEYSQTQKPCFTSYKNNSWGIPCCIPYSLLMRSNELTGDAGLKKLLQQSADISLVDNEKLALDLDTPEDLHRFNQSN